jgi:hypothetical protein
MQIGNWSTDAGGLDVLQLIPGPDGRQLGYSELRQHASIVRRLCRLGSRFCRSPTYSRSDRSAHVCRHRGWCFTQYLADVIDLLDSKNILTLERRGAHAREPTRPPVRRFASLDAEIIHNHRVDRTSPSLVSYTA